MSPPRSRIYPAYVFLRESPASNTLNRATGNRLKRKMVDCGRPARKCRPKEQIKGYAVGKDQYVMVEDDELAEYRHREHATPSTSRSSCPRPRSTTATATRPTTSRPEDKVGQEAFAVIRDAMKKKKMVGIARVVMARRERIMMLEPFGKGIMGTTLLYPYEIRGEEAVFEDIPDIKLPDQMVGLAEDIIDKMTGRVRAGQIRGPLRKRDDRAHSLQAGRPASAQGGATPLVPASVVNLMDASAPQRRGRDRQGQAAEGRTGKEGPCGTPSRKAKAEAGCRAIDGLDFAAIPDDRHVPPSSAAASNLIAETWHALNQLGLEAGKRLRDLAEEAFAIFSRSIGVP